MRGWHTQTTVDSSQLPEGWNRPSKLTFGGRREIARHPHRSDLVFNLHHDHGVLGIGLVQVSHQGGERLAIRGQSGLAEWSSNQMHGARRKCSVYHEGNRFP